MFGPFRTSAKPAPEPEPVKPTYPRLIVETRGADSRRLVETKKGVFVVERLVTLPDSMGVLSSTWLQDLKIEDTTSYQASVTATTVVWLVKRLASQLDGQVDV